MALGEHGFGRGHSAVCREGGFKGGVGPLRRGPFRFYSPLPRADWTAQILSVKLAPGANLLDRICEPEFPSELEQAFGDLARVLHVLGVRLRAGCGGLLAACAR